MKRQNIRKLILLISLLFFPVILYYFSPYLVIQASFAGIVGGSLVIFSLQLITSLFFGRAFCGWICPAGELQDLAAPINPKSAEGKKHNLVKYFIWAPWLLAIILGFISAGGILGFDFFYMTNHGISATDLYSYITYFLIVALFLILALLLGKRGACHTICWMAPFMIIGSKIKNRIKYPSLHLEVQPQKCVACKQCTRKCVMGLEVDHMVSVGNMVNDECVLCGECVDTCAKKAIRYRYIWTK